MYSVCVCVCVELGRKGSESISLFSSWEMELFLSSAREGWGKGRRGRELRETANKEGETTLGQLNSKLDNS